MNKLTRGIGSFIIALLMYSVPVALGYAFADGLNGFFKMLIVVCAIIQMVALTSFIYTEGDR